MGMTIEDIRRLEEAGDVEALVRSLRDESHKADWGVARALARVGTPAIGALQTSLRDNDQDVKEMVVWTFRKMGTPEGDAALIGCMQDGEEIVRSFAAQMLGDLGGEAVVEPLIRALEDPGMHVRFAAANSLGELGERRAVKALRRLLDDDVDFVRKAAAEVLEKIQGGG
jgi:HEAT repeat protein